MSKGGEPTERLFHDTVEGFFTEADVQRVENDPYVSHYINLITGEDGGDAVKGKPLYEQRTREEAAELLEVTYGYDNIHSMALVMHVEETRRNLLNSREGGWHDG